jgi:hypothetical protein
VRVLSRIINEFESPHCWPPPPLLLLLLLLLLCRLMGRLPIGYMGIAVSACLQVCFPQSEKQPSYPLAIFTNTVCMPQKKGLKGLREEQACSWSSMHGRPTGFFITASLLSSQLLSWGLWLEEQGQGGSHWHAGKPFKYHPRNHWKNQKFPFECSLERAPRIIRHFRFWPKNHLNSEVIKDLRYTVYEETTDVFVVLP